LKALSFNKIDKYADKQKELIKLTYEQKVELLESQIHSIYNLWNNSSLKINDIMSSYDTHVRDDESLKKQIIFYDNLLSQAIWTNKKIDYPNCIPSTVYQWSIFYCNLGYNIGSEQNKRRPVIILNDTKFLQSSIVLVAPITSNGKNLYDHEVQIIETAYNRVVGKIDLSHMRSVSKTRLDIKMADRLLNRIEYGQKYNNGENYTMLQDVISDKIKLLFGIAIR